MGKGLASEMPVARRLHSSIQDNRHPFGPLKSPKHVLQRMATERWREEHLDKMRSYRRKWYRENKAHAKQTVLRRRRDLKTFVNAYKAKHGCQSCPEHDPDCLVFHHCNGAKERTISRAILHGWSIEKLTLEISKCVVLCANCHLKLHAKMARSKGVDPFKTSFGDSLAQPVPSVRNQSVPLFSSTASYAFP